MSALKPADWVTKKDRQEFNQLGKRAAQHFLRQASETLCPSWSEAVEAVSHYDAGTGGADEIKKAGFRYLRACVKAAKK